MKERSCVNQHAVNDYTRTRRMPPSRSASIRAVRLSAFGWLAASLLMLPWLAAAQDLRISQVQPNRTQLDPARGDSLQLRFQLSAPAQVSLQLYDGREWLIREIPGKGVLSAGEHVLSWDLRDQAGRPVPPEAYTYALEARANDGKVVRYDLADATGGETVAARDVKRDAGRGGISYVLDRPSRVSVRMGLDNGGPLLRTLLDWVVRPAGEQYESWDGKDASGVLALSAHPRLNISVQAFSLPENSIIVGGRETKVNLIEHLSGAHAARPRTRPQPKRMYAHAQQPLQARGDFNVRLSLPDALPRSADGIPIVSGPIAVRLEVDAADRERALARRFEPVFFVDGQFAFENEVGFVPMTWNFDPAALSTGEHFLTVNLRGYEGNFGMATLKVLVQRDASAAGARR
jgi:hypothetical protein